MIQFVTPQWCAIKIECFQRYRTVGRQTAGDAAVGPRGSQRSIRGPVGRTEVDGAQLGIPGSSVGKRDQRRREARHEIRLATHQRQSLSLLSCLCYY